MKLTKFFFISVICCLCLVVNIHSQQKQIIRNEFYSAYRTALSKSFKLAQHKKTLSETFSANGNLTETEKMSEDRVPPDSYKSILERKTNEKATVYEFIKIGNETYSKNNNGDWKKGGSGYGSASGISNIETEQFTVEKAKLDEQSVKLFVQISIYTTPEKQKAYFKTRKWINKDELLLKEEFENGLFDSKKLLRRSITTYEYNPNIKIEAPKIN